ncbi:MAG: hypothetical protein LKI39_02715 [Bacteroides sp.]|jgi:hypothetical protein|nr:hypothetical protein [Bacteroides sp.]
MNDVYITSKSIPQKPRSDNYPVGTSIIKTSGGTTVIQKTGTDIDILTLNDTRDVTDVRVMSALRSRDEFISRITDSEVTVSIDYKNGLKLNGKNISEIVRLADGIADEDLTEETLLSAIKIIDEIEEKSISKLHADTALKTITFLEGIIAGNNASNRITADGDVEMQNLTAAVQTTTPLLSVTSHADIENAQIADYITVGGTTTSLDLVIQNLATIHHMTVQNTADIMNEIIHEYITSNVFVSGFLGEGFKVWKDAQGLWHGELDELTVRRIFTVFQLVVQRVVHQGGMVIRSAAGGKLKSVTDQGTFWKCEYDSTDDFLTDDQILCQTFTGTSMKRYWRLVTSAGSGYFDLDKTDCELGSANPEAGDEIAVLGNRTNTDRQSAQIDCAVGANAPYRDDYAGINSYSLEGKLINRTGNLSGITDADFGELSGPGLYGINVYLKGIFRLLSGKTVEAAISDAQTAAQDYSNTQLNNFQTTTYSSDIQALEDSIALKVSSSTYQSDQQTVNSRLSAAEVKITDEAINLTVSSQITDKVNAVQVGGRNLLLNSEVITTNDYASDADNYQYYDDKTCYLEAGVQYAISGTCPSGLIWSNIHLAIGSTNALIWLRGDDGSVQIISSSLTGTKGSLFYVSTTQTYTLRTNVYKSGQYTFSKIKIEKGNKATDWTPAPEDVANDAQTKANAAENNAKNYADSTFATQTTFNSSIQQLSDSISTKVSQTDFDTLSGTVSNHTSTLNQLPTTIDARITTQVNDGGIIKTHVESWFTLSGNTLYMGATAINISGATVFSSIPTKTEAQGYASDAQTAAISEAATDATNKVNAIQVGGTNLFRDGIFEAGTNPFSMNTSGSASITEGPFDVDNITPNYGNRTLYIQKNAIATDTYGTFAAFAIKPNTTYTMSLIYCSAGSITNSSSFSEMFNSSMSHISYFNIGITNTNKIWTKTKMTFVSSSDARYFKIRLGFYSTVGEDAWIAVDYIKFEEGNKATDWSPAPEDVSDDAQTRANGAQTISQDNLAQKIGYSSYADMVAKATAGQTIIDGGYLRTSLINTGAIVVGQISGLGNLATKNNVDLSTEVTNKSLATLDSAANSKLSGIAAGADVTANNIAAGIAGQGSLATKSSIGTGDLDVTIISGGKILTSLIEATNVVAAGLTAGQIAALDITTSKLTVADDCKIGDFTIYNGIIKSTQSMTDINAVSVELSIKGLQTSRVNLGVRNVRVGDFTATINNIETPVGVYVDSNVAIYAHGEIFSDLNGITVEQYDLRLTKGSWIEGFSTKTRRISGTINVDSTDSFISCIGVSTVNLPTSPVTGRDIFVCRRSHDNVTINSGSGPLICRSATSTFSSMSITNDGEIWWFKYDGQYWVASRMNT